MPSSNRWTSFIIPAVIGILPFLLFWRWLFKGEVLFWGTLLFQFWPWHYLAKTIALEGAWPLWNPLLGNGAPLLANLQTAFFYPPNLLYFLTPVEHGLTLSVILHLSLAGLSMYAYARQINLSPFAAAVSALSYMFSGYITGRTQFVTMINALAWFPLLLLLSERLARRRRLRDGLGVGMVLAIQLFAGHAQLWFYGLWLIGAYTLVRTWQETRGAGPGRTVPALIQSGLVAGGAVGLAMLLAAAQILPTAELTLQSPRGSGAGRTFALAYSFWPWRLVTLLAPDFFGHPARGDYWGYATYWEDHAYIGTLPFILALTAIWGYYRPLEQRRQALQPASPPTGQEAALSETAARPDAAVANPAVPFFTGLMGVSLVLAMGWNTPVYLWVFDTVPGFGFFQAPSRLLIWYTLAMTVLAGVGAQQFELTAANRRGWGRFLTVSVGIAGAGAAGVFLLSGVNLTFLRATTTLGIMLSLAGGLLLMRPARKQPNFSKKEGCWQGLALLFISFDLLRTAAPLLPFLPAAVFDQTIASAAFLKSQPAGYRFFVDADFEENVKFGQYFRFETFGPPAVGHWQALKETLIPNMGVYAHLPAANNDDPLTVGHWSRLMDLAQESDPAQRARLLAMMNVGYLIDAPAPSSRPVVYDDGAIAIQQIPEPLPRAYFVAQASPAGNAGEALAGLTAPDFDSRREVIIISDRTRPGLIAQSAGRTGHQGRKQVAKETVRAGEQPAEVGFQEVTISDQGPNRVTLGVEAPTSGFVVLTDTFYPGWQATINGRPADIWVANSAFRAVAVEAGRHEIIFTYHPSSFTTGLWLSAVTWLVTIVTSIILSKRQTS